MSDEPVFLSPPEGEGGARSAQPSGRVRGQRGYTFEALGRAKQLRNAMTGAERVMWGALRGGRLDGAKFRRQQPINPFIADFVCHEHRLIVEIDGSQHVESDEDGRRTEWLESAGYRVIRFWNNDVSMNLEGVLTTVSVALAAPHPPTASRRAPPSPSRGEGKNGATRNA